MAQRASGRTFKLGRKFNGKWYTIYAGARYPSKKQADKMADQLRKQGYSARVVKRSNHYLVYWRR